MWNSIGQNFRLFSAILAKVICPSNATHAHLSAGEGSQHFSAFHLFIDPMVHFILIHVSVRIIHGWNCIFSFTVETVSPSLLKAFSHLSTSYLDPIQLQSCIKE